ncbi:MAG: hypothetical protein KJT03_08220, partial [Verrucomicrobiae bacterium]|nr:hypothetical protein [Verrucomicrobiae bacterium]
PCLFYIGHSCMPFITLDTAEKILQAAPEYCLGFYTAEDEQVELIPRFFEYYFKPLANMCLRYGNKRCMTKNKGLWWITSPARPPVFDALFREGRNRITMAATEDSNSRTPEMNLMGRGGLWQAGLIQQNDVSIHSDLFSFNRFHQWEYPRVGHPYLRLLVAHATLGMTQVNSRIREYTSTRETADIETLGKESTGIFFKLLGKGLVFSPKPEDALGYSTVGLVMHPPPGDWLEDAHNGHSPEKWVEDEQLHQAVIPHNGSLWGMTNTPDHALQKILFNKQRQFGYQVPPTPYGLVAIVPAETDLSQVKGVKSWWHTDGVYAWKDGGSRLTGMEAATRMQADFAEAAQRLPFQQHGEPVFLNSLRVAQDHYRLFLIDPGWLDPADHEVTIEIHLEGEFTAQDTLNHRELSIRENRFTVDVPAGLFTIVDVRRIN